MRLLVFASLLQTACLLFLVGSVLSEKPASVPTASAVDVTAAPIGKPAGEPVSEMRLRRIIREELAALDLGNASSAAREPLPSRSPEVAHYQRELVSSQIDYYSSVGQITEKQMQELQREIAVLDEAGRREMLSKLTRAMNAGRIKGHL